MQVFSRSCLPTRSEESSRIHDVHDALIDVAILRGQPCRIELDHLDARGRAVYKLSEKPDGGDAMTWAHLRLLRDELVEPAISVDRLQSLEAMYLARVIVREGLPRAAEQAQRIPEAKGVCLGQALTLWADHEIVQGMHDAESCDHPQDALFCPEYADASAMTVAELTQDGDAKQKWSAEGLLPHAVLSARDDKMHMHAKWLKPGTTWVDEPGCVIVFPMMQACDLAQDAEASPQTGDALAAR